MDAINRFGKHLFNYAIASDTQKFLNYQQKTFKFPFPEFHKDGIFNLNYALTSNPDIHDGVMDLSFFMDIGPNAQHCILALDQNNYVYQDVGLQQAQFILTDRVVNCMLDAMYRQDYFHYTLSSEQMQQDLGTFLFPINAWLLTGAYPEIA